MHRFKETVMLCLVPVAALPLGCGDTGTAQRERDGKMVYVDRVTAEALVADISDEIPAVHPVTGKNTLMPGLYCAECKKWHPVPPADQINRLPGATRCPITGRPLAIEGPWPEDGNLDEEDAT